MYLALFLAALLYLYVIHKEKLPFFGYAVCMAVLVMIPPLNILLQKSFQNFYPAEAMRWLLPVFGVNACAVLELRAGLWENRKKRWLLPAACVLFLLCGLLSGQYETLHYDTTEDEAGEVYELVLEQAQEKQEKGQQLSEKTKQTGGVQVSFVAPRELMEGARAYDARILTVYGRDLWETDLDYAFYGNYEEWAYNLAQWMEEPVDGRTGEVFNALRDSGAKYVVFDKENLIYGEDMQYPKEWRAGRTILQRLGETRHYVVYERLEG